jgi:tripartite-type tricarboxylate transporter receptor subunit TctC
VPYKGTSPAMVDLLGGRVSMTFDAPAVYLEHIRAGKVRPLGVTSSQRMTVLPNVPTIAESGLPGYEVANWLGIFAPARTPPEVVNLLNAEINRAMADPALRKQMTDAGIEPLTSTPQQFAAFLKSEIAKWAGIVKASGARAD